MNIETVEQALERLKTRPYFHIVKINDNLYQDHYCDGEPVDYTARELIKLSKVYSSENRQNTSMKKNLKHYTNRKNRSHTRDLLKTEDFDKIPNQNDLVATDDPWNWD